MVAVYVTAAIGLPVYMHYCGGELEQVSVLVKSNSCCGEDESDMAAGCCADENTVVRCAPDFTTKKINTGVDFKLPGIDLFVFNTFQLDVNLEETSSNRLDFIFPPPKLLQECIVKTSVLLI